MKKLTTAAFPFLLAIVGGSMVLAAFNHFVMLKPQVRRSVAIRNLQCIECEYFDENKMRVTSIKKIGFEAVYEVYRRPTELARFPDGGSGWYFKRERKPYQLNLQTGELTQLSRPLPLYTGYGVLRDHILPTKSAMDEALKSETNITKEDFNNSIAFQIVNPKTGIVSAVKVSQFNFEWEVVTIPIMGFNFVNPYTNY